MRIHDRKYSQNCSCLGYLLGFFGSFFEGFDVKCRISIKKEVFECDWLCCWGRKNGYFFRENDVFLGVDDAYYNGLEYWYTASKI